jgi:hypothetical protein
VTDDRNQLSGFEKAAHELHGALIHSQGVGVHDATREHWRIEVVRPRTVERTMIGSSG